MGVRWYHFLILIAAGLGLALLLLPGPRERGLLQFRSREDQPAADTLSDAFRADPADASVATALIELHLRRDRPAEAAAVAERYLEEKPDDAAFRERLVELRLSVGDIAGAIRALEALPKTPGRRDRLLALYREANDLDGAIRLVREFPPSADKDRRLVALYRETGRLAEAADYLRARIEAGAPHRGGLLSLLAEIERDRGDAAAELAALESLSALEPTPDVWRRILEIRTARGGFADAVPAADALAASGAPLPMDTWRRIRAVRERTGDAEGLLAAVDAIRRREESTPRDWIDWLRLLAEAPAEDVPENAVDAALARHPDEPEVLAAAVHLADRSGRPARAAELYARYARLVGGEDLARAAAVRYETIDRLADARAVLADLVDWAEAAPRTLWMDADYALRLDRAAPAAEQADRLAERLSREPPSVEAGRLAYNLYVRLERPRPRLAVAERLAELGAADFPMLLDLAAARTDAGEAERALAYLAQAGTVSPTDPVAIRRERARALVARAYALPADDPELRAARLAAAGALEAALRDEPTAGHLETLADLQLALGQLEEAQSTLRALGMDRAPLSLVLTLAEALAAENRPAEARTLLGRAESAQALSPRELALLAGVYERLGDTEAAADAYERAVMEADPPEEAWVRALGRLLVSLGRTADAEALLTRLESPPASLLLDLADARITQGEEARARALLGRVAAGAEPEPDTDARMRVAYLYTRLGDDAAAAEVYEALVAAEPENDEAVLALADTLGRLGRRERQIAILRERAEVRNAGRAWMDLADRYRWAGDRTGEAAALERAVEATPDDPVILARQVSLLAALGREEEARALYRSLLALESAGDVETRHAVVLAMLAMGDAARARPRYEALLEEDVLESDDVLALARAAASAQGYTDATALYRSYIAMQPEDWRGWYELGELLYESGRAAPREHLRALALLPQDPSPAILSIRARIHRRLGYIDRAIGLHERALRQGLTDPDIGCNFVDLLLTAGKLEWAHEVIGQVREGFPQHVRARRIEALVLLAKKRVHEALALLRALAEERPHDPYVLSDLGFAEERAGNWQKAQAAYDRAARRRPETAPPEDRPEADAATPPASPGESGRAGVGAGAAALPAGYTVSLSPEAAATVGAGPDAEPIERVDGIPIPAGGGRIDLATDEAPLRTDRTDDFRRRWRRQELKRGREALYTNSHKANDVEEIDRRTPAVRFPLTEKWSLALIGMDGSFDIDDPFDPDDLHAEVRRLTIRGEYRRDHHFRSWFTLEPYGGPDADGVGGAVEAEWIPKPYRRLRLEAETFRLWDETTYMVAADGFFHGVNGMLQFPVLPRGIVTLDGELRWQYVGENVGGPDFAARTHELGARFDYILASRPLALMSEGVLDREAKYEDAIHYQFNVFLAWRREHDKIADDFTLVPLTPQSEDVRLGAELRWPINRFTGVIATAYIGQDEERNFSWGEMYGWSGRLLWMPRDLYRLWLGYSMDAEAESGLSGGRTEGWECGINVNF